MDKTYETTVRLGQATTTYDSEGEVTAEHPVSVSAAQLTAALDATPDNMVTEQVKGSLLTHARVAQLKKVAFCGL